MKDSTAVVIGVGVGLVAYGAGVLTECALNQGRINDMENKLNNICKSVDSLSNIDLTIPDDLAKVVITKAADKAAAKVADSAVKSTTKDIKESVKTRVSNTLNDMYKDVEEDVKNKLMDQVNIASIERIEKQVADKVADKVFKQTPKLIVGDTSKNDIIQTCLENGMDAFDIRRVLEAAK